MSDRTCTACCPCGPNGEMLRCGYLPGHSGAHAWASLPTFVRPETPGVLEIGPPGSRPFTSGAANGVQVIASREWWMAVCSSLGDGFPHVTAILSTLASEASETAGESA